jgi:hypothetical protein
VLVAESAVGKGKVMEKVFTVRHTIVRGDDEDHKEIGTYTSEAKAKAAIEHVKSKPGFSDPRGYFKIDSSFLDFDYWADGFGPSDAV